MASCDPFDVQFSGSAKDLFKQISALIQEQGGTISGGASGGAFSVPVPIFGTVAGNYSVAGQTATIHITRKSFFLPCATIENFIRSNVPQVAQRIIGEFAAFGRRSCPPFSVEFVGDAKELFMMLVELAEENGATLNGDETGGSFSGSLGPITIRGEYSVTGQVVTVTITRKPLFFPTCDMIEGAVRDNVPQAARRSRAELLAAASCAPFDVQFSGSAKELFMKVVVLVENAGGRIMGDETGGTFSGSILFFRVAGKYSVAGQTVTVTITDKTSFPSCAMIEDFVRSNIPQVAATAIGAL